MSRFAPMINIDPPSSDATLTAAKKAGLTRFLVRARRAVGLTGTVDVLLTSDAEMRRLNRLFRGKNKATDVLSFPAAEEAAGVAGDLAISLETAERQAQEQGHGLTDELRVLLLHGLLHLDGEDHETDAGQMAAREAELRRELRLKPGLVERAGATNVRRAAHKRAVADVAAALAPWGRRR